MKTSRILIFSLALAPVAASADICSNLTSSYDQQILSVEQSYNAAIASDPNPVDDQALLTSEQTQITNLQMQEAAALASAGCTTISGGGTTGGGTTGGGTTGGGTTGGGTSGGGTSGGGTSGGGSSGGGDQNGCSDAVLQQARAMANGPHHGFGEIHQFLRAHGCEKPGRDFQAPYEHERHECDNH